MIHFYVELRHLRLGDSTPESVAFFLLIVAATIGLLIAFRKVSAVFLWILSALSPFISLLIIYLFNTNTKIKEIQILPSIQINANLFAKMEAWEAQAILTLIYLFTSALFTFIYRQDRQNRKNAQQEAATQKLLDNFTKNAAYAIPIKKIDKMDGFKFEEFVCRLMIKKGYDAKVTKKSGDQGIDVIAEKDGEQYGIQAKRNSKPVGNRAVQEVYTGLSFYGCKHGIIITNNRFTKSAVELANKTGIQLIDRENLIKLMENDVYNNGKNDKTKGSRPKDMSVSKEKICELEKIFIANDRKGIDDGGKSYQYAAGKINVLLSAPHSVKQVNLKKTKKADVFTGGITCYLKELTDCHIIYKKYNDDKDANNDSDINDNGYKSAVKEIVQKNNIKTLIDLHGMQLSADVKDDIVIGIGAKKKGIEETALPKTLDTIIKIFNKHKINVGISYSKFNAASPNNITKYIHTETKIENIQLEISPKYRNPDDMDNFGNLINSLVEIINFLK